MGEKSGHTGVDEPLFLLFRTCQSVCRAPFHLCQRGANEEDYGIEEEDVEGISIEQEIPAHAV